MKTRVIEVDKIQNIICDYWNQMGDTLSTQAKEYLEEQIEICSIEVDLEETNDDTQLKKKHKEAMEKLDNIIDKLKNRT